MVITVRLVDGSSYNEGRVEVYYNGDWGTVCNDGWNENYASLVCTQLGFGSFGKVTDYGPGSGTQILEKVLCTANDTILGSCGHYGVGITVECNHNNDVGVKCNGMLCTMFVIIPKSTMLADSKASAVAVMPTITHEVTAKASMYSKTFFNNLIMCV